MILYTAMSKGDERTRTMDIYVDNVIVTTWASSGTTLDFENVTLGVTGSTIELRGVLEDSEWLSVMEVQIGCSALDVMGVPVLFFVYLEMSLFPTIFSASLCMESTSHVLSFRMVFFLPCDHGLDF